MKLIFLFLFPAVYLFAQPTLEYSYSASMDYILNNYTNEESSNSYISEICDYYYYNKININSEEIKKITDLPFIDFRDYKNLEDEGSFNSLDDIVKILGIEKTSLLQHFITISRKSVGNNNMKLLYRSRNITDSKTNNIKNSNRLNISYGRYDINLVTEKDYGEKNYFDFISGNLEMKINDKISAIIGDFNFKFAKGLSTWSSYPLNKSENFIYTVTKSSNSSFPYISSNESIFYRGISFTFKLPERNISLYLSKKSQDASLDYDGNIKSFLTTGIHESENQLQKKFNSKIRAVGGFIDLYNAKYFNSSFYFSHNKFSRNYIWGSNKINGFNIFSVYFRYLRNKFFADGEINKYKNKLSYLGSLKYKTNSKFKYLVSVRRIYNLPFNIYQNPLSEKSGSFKENGILSGFEIGFSFLKLKLYYDIYRIDDNHGTNGNEFFLSAHSKLYKRIKLKIRYKSKNERSYNIDRKRYTLSCITKLPIDRNSYFNIRLDKSWFNDEISKSDGHSLFWEYVISLNKLGMRIRFQHYNINDYNSRIYTYESSLSNMFENRILLGSGFNGFMLAKLNLLDILQAIFKLSYNEYHYEKKLYIKRKYYFQLEMKL